MEDAARFLYFLGAPIIYNAKSVFRYANLRWLNIVSDVYLVSNLVLVSRVWAFPQSIGPSAIQAASQSTLINAQLYSTCD